MQKGVSESSELSVSKPQGTCYKDAFDYMVRIFTEDAEFRVCAQDLLLVHGEITCPKTHKRIRHAWVEREGTVYEPQFGELWLLPDFYQFLKAKVFRKYMFKEAFREVLRTKTYDFSDLI
jgi:hypothetical protein